MTNAQTKLFDWDEIVDDSFISVSDITNGQIVKPRKLPDGNCISKNVIDFAKEGEDPNPKTVYLLHCEIDGSEVNLKIPKTTVLNLKNCSKSNHDTLSKQTYKIQIAGKGSYKYIELLLSS